MSKNGEPHRRIATLDQIYENPEVIALSRTDKHEAEKRLDRARTEYEIARHEMMKYELVLYFRVAIFGSARLEEQSKEFQFVKSLAKSIVNSARIDIVTGGGPGIMEAANQGLTQAHKEAHERGQEFFSANVASTIQLPFEEEVNPELHFATRHADFTPRLQEFVDMTNGAYNAPGGAGTLLEMSLLNQLRQVGHLEENYKILAHSTWQPIIDTWNDELYHKRVANGCTPTISEKDLNLIQITDDIDEIVAIFKEQHNKWRKDIRNKIKIVD